MGLEYLVPLVVLGILAIVISVRLMVNHSERLIEDGGQASEIFALDYPMSVTGLWIVSDDSRVAIGELSEPRNSVGLVEVMGSKHITRLLSKGDVRQVKTDDNGIELLLADFTLPSVKFILANNAKKRILVDSLDAVTDFSGSGGKAKA